MSSTSSSSRAAALALGLAAAAATGCAARQAPRPSGAIAPGQRVVVLPVANGGGVTGAPLDRILAEAVRAVSAAGLEPVTGAPVEAFLAAHRLRSTTGIDRASAGAVRAELGADAVLLTSVDQWAPGGVPKVALSMRLVSVAGEPTIDWIDAASRAGDDAPGWFGLGLTTSIEEVAQQVTSALSRSLAGWVRGRGARAPVCAAGGAFGPKLAFRSPALPAGRPATIAVLPFLDGTPRRTGGAVALEFVRHLVANPALRVLEPGVVRSEVIRFRIVQDDGVSLEQARLLLDVLDADLVLAGEVRDHDDAEGSARAPTASFTVQVLERSGRRVVWESTSRSGGDDAMGPFGTLRIRTANGLACRMVASVVDGMAGRGRAERARAAPLPAAAPAPAQRGPESVDPAQALRGEPATNDQKTTDFQ